MRCWGTPPTHRAKLQFSDGLRKGDWDVAFGSGYCRAVAGSGPLRSLKRGFAPADTRSRFPDLRRVVYEPLTKLHFADQSHYRQFDIRLGPVNFKISFRKNYLVAVGTRLGSRDLSVWLLLMAFIRERGFHMD